MTREALLKETLRGRLLLVGEYRGSHADRKEYVDTKSGEVIVFIRGIHLLELSWAGRMERAVIYERLPANIQQPEDVEFPYEKGSRMVFLLESAQWKSHQLLANLLPGSKPEKVEDAPKKAMEEAECGAVDAPRGAPPPASAPNLVLLETTPQSSL